MGESEYITMNDPAKSKYRGARFVVRWLLVPVMSLCASLVTFVVPLLAAEVAVNGGKLPSGHSSGNKLLTLLLLGFISLIPTAAFLVRELPRKKRTGRILASSGTLLIASAVAGILVLVVVQGSVPSKDSQEAGTIALAAVLAFGSGITAGSRVLSWCADLLAWSCLRHRDVVAAVAVRGQVVLIDPTGAKEWATSASETIKEKTKDESIVDAVLDEDGNVLIVTDTGRVLKG